MKNQKGFSLIELLIVVSVIGLMMTVALPISASMYARYQASLKAQEVMIAVSDLRREAFLYSESKIISAYRHQLTVNGESRNFPGAQISVESPIQFYKNGTTSGGEISVRVGEHVFVVSVKAPLGDLKLVSG